MPLKSLKKRSIFHFFVKLFLYCGGMTEVIDALTRFYGLDWMAMLLGLSGTYLISNADKRGFALNGLACLCGLTVAYLSQQVGFVAYNAILVALMYKGYTGWNRKQSTSVQS